MVIELEASLYILDSLDTSCDNVRPPVIILKNLSVLPNTLLMLNEPVSLLRNEDVMGEVALICIDCVTLR